MSKGCKLWSQGQLNLSCRLQRNPFSQTLPSKRQHSAGEASGKAGKLGLVHGLHLVAFTRWDVQQQTKETGSKGFRYLERHQATVVQTRYRLPLGVYQKRIKSCFVFRRFLLVNSQIWRYLIIHMKRYKLHVVLGAPAVPYIHGNIPVISVSCSRTEKQDCNFHAWPSASHSPTLIVS